ncbi:hypothetical protein [Curtobacterium sp. S6]|uniref:PH-like domain-containing protein n=1 Tax=Curtobacterium sp. S6 TaxID=1479623 RepID=UPI0006921BEE|nr:hypothetical protein [Curtobacterium sp. S6]
MTLNHMLTLVSSVILAGIVFSLIAWGWRSRTKRQAGIADLPEVPRELDGAAAEFACDVQYVCTTTAGDWLDRIAVHGLGVKANGQALVYPTGLIVTRDGARDLWIGSESIEVLRRESGMAGKFVEKDGLAVISWRLGGRLVDTGLRTRRAADTPELLDRLRDHAPQASSSLPATDQNQDTAASDDAASDHPSRK